MELVRLLLLQTEAGVDLPEVNARDVKEVLHHIAILKDASLVEGEVHSNSDGQIIVGQIFRLTWQGHEFLDVMRNDSVWKKAKAHVLKSGASWTFEILKDFLKHEAMRQLGISPTP